MTKANCGIRNLKDCDIVKGPLLGQGSFGKAFSCKVRTENGRWENAVLKTLSNCKNWQFFLEESQHLLALQGIDGVPTLYGIQNDALNMGIIMSYNGSMTLDKFMKQNLQNPQKVCEVLAKVAKILKEIHSRGLGHNDLHSENIMVDVNDDLEQGGKEPVPTVIDYGYALPFGSQLFPNPIPNFTCFHYDPILSRDCGLTTRETDIFSFAKLAANINLGHFSSAAKQHLDNLCYNAFSPDKEDCPSLGEFREALVALKEAEGRRQLRLQKLKKLRKRH